MWVASGNRRDIARKNPSAVLIPETFQHFDSSSIACEIMPSTTRLPNALPPHAVTSDASDRFGSNSFADA
jgi:hypothetical protein